MKKNIKNIFNKILIERKSKFYSGRDRIIFNANPEQAFLTRLFNSIRTKRPKTFANLLDTGHKSGILYKLKNEIKKHTMFEESIFDTIYEEIIALFFVCDYDGAIKIYEKYLNFLIKTENEFELQRLMFLIFPEGKNMAGKKLERQRIEYTKLFGKYVLTKKVFGGWEDFEHQKFQLFNRMKEDPEITKMLITEYNKNVTKNLEIATNKYIERTLTR